MTAKPMKIEKANTEAVRQVALAMRDRDFEEFSAVSTARSRRELAEYLTASYGMRDDVQVAYYEGKPIAVIGQIMLWPNVVSLLFFATEDFPKIIIPVTRFYRKLFNRFEAEGVHRIQAVSLAGYNYTHQFLSLFDLAPEGPPMLGFGKNGEAFIQFARVKA